MVRCSVSRGQGLSWALIVAVSLAGCAVPSGEVERLMDRYHELGQLHGAVLVAHQGELVLKKAYGEANREWAVPNTTDTRFRLGSVTKQLTAALVMTLVDERRLRLDQTVSQALPGFREDVGSRVTIHQLLTHSSGITMPSMSTEQYWDLFQRRLTTEQILETLCSGDLAFEPGQRSQYSSAGYLVLGAIIEQVTGQSYGEALAERALRPAGMTSTGIDDPELVIPRRATGYQTNYGLGTARYKYMPSSFSSGSLYSTVEDLYRWNRALDSDLVLSAASRRLMVEPHIDSHRGSFGYGWFLADWKIGESSTPVSFHGGDVSGFGAFMLRSEPTGTFVALLSNQEGLMYYDIAENLLRVVNGFDAVEPRPYVADLLRHASLSGGLDHARQVLAEIRDRGLEHYDTDEDELVELGYDLLAISRRDEAVLVLRLAVELHGESANAHDSLGDALFAAGDPAGSAASYQAALELDPGSTNAAEMLERIRAETSEPSLEQ